MTSTIARRTTRYDRAELARNQYVSTSTIGIATSATSPSRTSRWMRIAELATTEISEVITDVSPVARSSFSASMSEASHEMMRPDVERSQKDSEGSWTCANSNCSKSNRTS